MRWLYLLFERRWQAGTSNGLEDSGWLYTNREGYKGKGAAIDETNL